MTDRINKLKVFFDERRIGIGIAMAIVSALIMTTVSMMMYDMDDVSRLDVSLPNREKIRPSTREDDMQKFASTGLLDREALLDFQVLFSKNRASLNALSKFDGNVLSDESLHIGVSE